MILLFMLRPFIVNYPAFARYLSVWSLLGLKFVLLSVGCFNLPSFTLGIRSALPVLHPIIRRPRLSMTGQRPPLLPRLDSFLVLCRITGVSFRISLKLLSLFTLSPTSMRPLVGPLRLKPYLTGSNHASSVPRFWAILTLLVSLSWTQTPGMLQLAPSSRS